MGGGDGGDGGGRTFPILYITTLIIIPAADPLILIFGDFLYTIF